MVTAGLLSGYRVCGVIAKRGAEVPDIDSMARTESAVENDSVDRWAPDRGARVKITGTVLAAYERDEGVSVRDSAWLDAVLDEYCVATLPAPAYVVFGPMAGWRCWEVQLAPRS